MSRSFKGAKEFVPNVEMPDPVVMKVPQSPGFLDTVAKFGPLLIAIIAVAFCFYIYKKVLVMDRSPNLILKNFIDEQTKTNFQIQESYNAMVEQFNNLSGLVHNSLVKNGTIQTQISPSPSVMNDMASEDKIEEVTKVESPASSDPIPANEALDNMSEISSVIVSSSKPRKGRKPKNEVNF